MIFLNLNNISNAQLEKKNPTLSSVNGLCNDTGQKVVDNLKDCKDAVSFVTSTYSSVTELKRMSNEGYPRGCFLLSNYGWLWNDRYLFFNTHKLGNREANSQQLCKPSKINNIKITSVFGNIYIPSVSINI